MSLRRREQQTADLHTLTDTQAYIFTQASRLTVQSRVDGPETDRYIHPFVDDAGAGLFDSGRYGGVRRLHIRFSTVKTRQGQASRGCIEPYLYLDELSGRDQ